ncbi:MAG TPA: DNA-binding protein, partial [Bradyrhizobium sp.]
MTLVDSNILLDIFTRTPNWWEWAVMQLEEAVIRGPLLINDVIYAETSVRFHSIDDFDVALAKAGVAVAPMPRLALFLAGKAFARYRGS